MLMKFVRREFFDILLWLVFKLWTNVLNQLFEKCGLFKEIQKLINRLPNLFTSTSWDKICWAKHYDSRLVACGWKFIIHPVLTYLQICRRKEVAFAMFLSALLENLPFCQIIQDQYRLLFQKLQKKLENLHTAWGNLGGFYKISNLFRGAIHCSLTKLSFGQKLLLFFV